MATSNSRRHLFAKQYHDHVNAWLESGLSQSAFCQMHQLPLSTFNKWVSRIQGPSKLSLPKLSKQKTKAEVNSLTLITPRSHRLQKLRWTFLHACTK